MADALRETLPGAQPTLPDHGERGAKPRPRVRRRYHVEVWFAVTVLVLAVVLALLAPWIAPHSPTSTQLIKGLKPPFWLEGGSLQYPLGTDRLGRDVLSRILFGLQISLTVSVLGGALLGLVSGSLAILAGYLRGWFDALVQRAGEISLALPGILIALVLALTRGPGLDNVIAVIVLVVVVLGGRDGGGLVCVAIDQ